MNCAHALVCIRYDHNTAASSVSDVHVRVHELDNVTTGAKHGVLHGQEMIIAIIQPSESTDHVFRFLISGSPSTNGSFAGTSGIFGGSVSTPSSFGVASGVDFIEVCEGKYRLSSRQFCITKHSKGRTNGIISL